MGGTRRLEESYPELAGDIRPVVAHEGPYSAVPLRAGDPAASTAADGPGAGADASGKGIVGGGHHHAHPHRHPHTHPERPHPHSVGLGDQPAPTGGAEEKGKCAP